MTRITSLDKAVQGFREDQKEKQDDQINEQATRAGDIIMKLAVDEATDSRVTLTKLTQMADVLQEIQDKSDNPDNKEQLRKGKPLELGSSSSSPSSDSADDSSPELDRVKSLASDLGIPVDELMKWMEGAFKPLTEASTEESKARSIAMQEIASGTTKVDKHGKLQVEQELNDLQQSFAPYQRMAASLKGISDDESKKRLKGMHLVADGTTKIKDDGTPDVPTPAGIDLDELIQTAAVYKGYCEDIAGNVDKIKALKVVGPEHWELDFSGLEPAVFKFLTHEDKPSTN